MILIFKRFLLVLFFGWHLLVMLVMPNLGSFLGRQWGRWLQPYAAVVGLNAGWNFFSPDPAHTMYFRLTLEKPNDQFEEIFFPQEKASYVAGTNDRRYLYAMRYMALDPRRAEALLVPWICRTHPGTDLVRIEHIVEKIPSLDLSVLEGESDREPIQTMDNSYNCESTSEVVL